MIFGLIIELLRLSLIAGIAFGLFIVAINLFHYAIILLGSMIAFVLSIFAKLGG